MFRSDLWDLIHEEPVRILIEEGTHQRHGLDDEPRHGCLKAKIIQKYELKHLLVNCE